MPFANTSQGQASIQGIPPLNVFDHIPFPGDPPGGLYTEQWAASTDGVNIGVPGTYFTQFYDVHNYQSLRIWMNWWLKIASIGSPNSSTVTVNWYPDQLGAPNQNPQAILSSETYYIWDNGQTGGLLPSSYPAVVETPVKGYWVQMVFEPGVPAGVGGVMYLTLTGQYRTLLVPQFQADSAYFGVSGGTARGNMYDRYASLVTSKAAGGASQNDYPPMKSGKAHIHYLAGTVTAAQALFSILNSVTGQRITGTQFPAGVAGFQEYESDVLLPNVPLQLQFGQPAAGYTFAQISIVYEN